MNVEEARPIGMLLSGYWPTPTLTPEETMAYVYELTAGPMRIQPEEATTVVKAAARHGADFRLRPGQLCADVQALRRKRALDGPQIGMLMPVTKTEGYSAIAAANLNAGRRACEAARLAMIARRQRVREMAR